MAFWLILTSKTVPKLLPQVYYGGDSTKRKKGGINRPHRFNFQRRFYSSLSESDPDDPDSFSLTARVISANTVAAKTTNNAITIALLLWVDAPAFGRCGAAANNLGSSVYPSIIL
jgi:hypothetical protein